MLRYIICAVLLAAWFYLMSVLDRAKLNFWHFIVGSLGLFLFLMVMIRPVMTDPLAKAVAAMAGLIGSMTRTFTPFFRYGIIFVASKSGSITLQVDFECSGVIEIMAYLSLLVFFRVYTKHERVLLSVIGVAYIMIANALRVVIICEAIHFMGTSVYHVAHTIVGRIFFYVLSIVLYFFVFTKPHIIRMKIGKFTYGHS